MCRRDGVGQVAAFGLRPDAGLTSVVPPAAGHDEQVRGHVGERPVRFDSEPMARSDDVTLSGDGASHPTTRQSAPRSRTPRRTMASDVESVEAGDCNSVHALDTADGEK